MVEFAYITESRLEVVADDADLRVPAGLWKRYVDARAKLAAVDAELGVRAEKPLVVTPDQESVMRAAVRPGTWIVVREPVARVGDIPSAPTPPDAEGSVGEPVSLVDAPVVSMVPEPPGPQKRPPLGPCQARSGLVHSPTSYVVTEASSVYYPGRVRVDGVCRCGLRIADVRCPHQKQQPGVLPPRCAWCQHVIIARSGMIDNRDANGKPDPNKPTLIPIGASGDDHEVKFAFRSEDGA